MAEVTLVAAILIPVLATMAFGWWLQRREARLITTEMGRMIEDGNARVIKVIEDGNARVIRVIDEGNRRLERILQEMHGDFMKALGSKRRRR